MSRVLAALATLAIVASSFAFTSNVALGHEHRSVGPYTFVVGWINEPAYVNAANADLSARLDSMQTLVIVAIAIAALALLASVGGLVMRRR